MGSKKGCGTNNNNTGNWNHLKTNQKIPEQRTGGKKIQGTAESSHIGHSTRTVGGADVKAQNI